MTRKAKISRKTRETNIVVEANIDGKGSYKINTRIGFSKSYARTIIQTFFD